MFNTIRNAWRIPDLRKKLLYTLLIIIVFRFGSVIPAPFLDASALSDLMASAGGKFRFGLYQHADRRRLLLRLSVCHGYYPLYQQLHHYAAADHCYPASGAPCERGRGGPQEDCHHHPVCHGDPGLDPGRGYYFYLRSQGIVEYTDALPVCLWPSSLC